MSHEVELTAFQRKLYKAVQEAYERDRAQLDRSAASYKLARSGAIFKMLQGLREICNHPACLDKKRRPSDVAAADYPAAEKEKASGKSEKLHELLEETIFPNNEKVLIFCTSLSAIDVLSKQIQRRFNTQPLVLQGDVSQKQRDALVQQFQTDDRCTVLLSSGVGGTGLTLTAATHVVHYDRCYNPAKEAQCTDRAHRIGQHRTVTVHTLTSQDSFEARLDEIMQHPGHADQSISDFRPGSKMRYAPSRCRSNFE
ncbi:ywqA, partial [Symbiodinium sp. CCMP2456]